MARNDDDGDRRPTDRVHPRADRAGGVPGRVISGRPFVLAAVVGLLGLWGGLYLAFLGWRGPVERRIAFGKAQVAAAVRPLSEVNPPGVAAPEWRSAVEQSEAMLREVVGTGRLDRDALESLRADVDRRVASATRSPGDAPALLGSLWDDMARLKRFRPETRRPAILPPPGIEKTPPTPEASP